MERETFSAIWVAQRTDLLRYLQSLTRDADLAEDLCQATAERAWRARARLEAPDQARPWLFRIATNAWLDDRRRQRPSPLDDTVGAVAPGHDEAARLDAAALLVEVAAFIETLPPKQRAALVLRKHHEADYAAIATTLGCSEVAARRSVHEGLRKVREAFAARLLEGAE
jgi:RNA polymerase sigma-70 factor (ECF subfamily)